MGGESLSFIEALSADGPAHDRADKMMLYGQFIGAWDGTVTRYGANGERFDSSAEVHFGWALQGRAIQDVWIVPSRLGRAPGEADKMNGTTLRIYDPQHDNWQITFIDPVRQTHDRMTGRQVGVDIVQEYRDQAGTICQWCFTEIEANSFHWISRVSSDERATWRLTAEYYLRRRKRPEQTQADAALPESAAFDFWQGAWRVTDPNDGKLLGFSKVDRILGGRVLHEQWSGADGYCGESFNIFDKDRRCWHQSWVSDDGTLLLLDGGSVDRAMDLQGAAADGERHRIRWTPQADGSVLQLWEASGDGGASWRLRLAGLYRPV
ncbi:MAG TPA: hypothetical protein VKR55_11470 [Bradyrhizobium sp.]|uniref:hypothetical protein n=1 Tax=Bradyrhizobium sp. TaxID=376 RepID=UPI002C982319|nr:hypothetical protein [Bradyrhizobium sp.]HLZ02756.1 hypothetical protein [Bradyrhizobium sp.]